MNLVFCEFYDNCGTATYIDDSDLEYYKEGYQCAECMDQLDMYFYDLIDNS